MDAPVSAFSATAAPAAPERAFFSSVREWTWIKHTILARYIRPWSMKVGTLARTIWIVDCFAGAGSYHDELTGEHHHGSPVIAAIEAVRYAEQRPGRSMRVICVERNRANYRDLCARVVGLGDVTTLHGNFARHIETITEMIGADPALIFLDPIGLKAINAQACKRLLQRKGKTDVFVIADFGIVHRTRGQFLPNGEPDPAIPGAAANAQNVDAFFGNSQRWRNVDRSLPAKVRERTYLQIYFEDVLSSWFDYMGACPVRRAYDALPEYWMVNAASHVDAYLLMNDEVAKIDKQLFFRTYGENAFPEVIEAEYAEIVKRRLAALERDIVAFVHAAGAKGVTFKAVVLSVLDRHFGLAKIGKWSGDYARLIRKLIDDGVIVREKPQLAARFESGERLGMAP